MITNYGLDNFLIMIAVGVVSIAIGLVFRTNLFILIPLLLIGTFLILLAIWFFRDPPRKIPIEAINNPRLIISPADGKIMEIVEDIEPYYINGKSKRITIFLSPLDVHVNRVPISGIIRFFKFIDGKKIVASLPEASAENQQTLFGIENEFGKILFKQIVGILARRLVWDIKVGDTVQVGQKFGMMKFGSRMDIHIPINSEIKIKINDKVTAGITNIAILPDR